MSRLAWKRSLAFLGFSTGSKFELLFTGAARAARLGLPSVQLLMRILDAGSSSDWVTESCRSMGSLQRWSRLTDKYAIQLCMLA